MMLQNTPTSFTNFVAGLQLNLFWSGQHREYNLLGGAFELEEL